MFYIVEVIVYSRKTETVTAKKFRSPVLILKYSSAIWGFPRTAFDPFHLTFWILYIFSRVIRSSQFSITTCPVICIVHATPLLFRDCNFNTRRDVFHESPMLGTWFLAVISDWWTNSWSRCLLFRNKKVKHSDWIYKLVLALISESVYMLITKVSRSTGVDLEWYCLKKWKQQQKLKQRKQGRGAMFLVVGMEVGEELIYLGFISVPLLRCTDTVVGYKLFLDIFLSFAYAYCA